MDQAPYPSAEQWAELTDITEDLSEVDWDELTWEEALEALKAFCRHPAVIFASRVCDVVRGGTEEE